MKIDELRKKLRKDRPMTTVNLSIPVDVIRDLQRISPNLGFSDYRALMRAYIGKGLRSDQERLEAQPELSDVVESLRKHGVDDAVIASAMAEAKVA